MVMNVSQNGADGADTKNLPAAPSFIIFRIFDDDIRYLSVGADGGGYTNCVPIKMDPLSLSATEHMRSD